MKFIEIRKLENQKIRKSENQKIRKSEIRNQKSEIRNQKKIIIKFIKSTIRTGSDLTNDKFSEICIKK